MSFFKEEPKDQKSIMVGTTTGFITHDPVPSNHKNHCPFSKRSQQINEWFVQEQKSYAAFSMAMKEVNMNFENLWKLTNLSKELQDTVDKTVKIYFGIQHNREMTMDVIMDENRGFFGTLSHLKKSSMCKHVPWLQALVLTLDETIAIKSGLPLFVSNFESNQICSCGCMFFTGECISL